MKVKYTVNCRFRVVDLLFPKLGQTFPFEAIKITNIQQLVLLHFVFNKPTDV